MALTLRGAVMLGTTVPEPSRTDDRIYVCSAAWHDDLGLIRIYPLAMGGAPRRWDTFDVDVERNPKDSRRESWKIAGGPGPRNAAFRVTGRYRDSDKRSLLDLAARHRIPTSIPEANAARASLALVTPSEVEFELEHNADSPDSPQLRLFDQGLPEQVGAKRFPWIPRLRFNDGSGHRLMLRDWGCYEHMRKLPGRERELPKALHLGPRSALLVGNLNNQRNAWVVISVLNINYSQLPLTYDTSAA